MRMIKISSWQPALPGSAATRKKKASSASGSDFAGLIGGFDDDSAAETAPVKQAAPLGATNPLLGLQEISDDEVQRRQAYKTGQMTLEALDELRLGLLQGSLSARVIAQMESLVAAERHRCNDPRLEAILDDIELRAAVELAKLEKERNR